MNILDYIIVSAVSACLIAAVCYIIRQRKAGRSVSCGGGCTGCAKNCPQAGGKRNENS